MKPRDRVRLVGPPGPDPLNISQGLCTGCIGTVQRVNYVHAKAAIWWDVQYGTYQNFHDLEIVEDA